MEEKQTIIKTGQEWISCGSSVTFTVKAQSTDIYVPYTHATPKPKPKPVEKPKHEIFTKYSDEERAAYMEIMECIKKSLKVLKWGGFCERDYKVMKSVGHPDEYLFIAEKYKHYFYLKISDNRRIEMRVEDPMSETLHSFYLDYDSELDVMAHAANVLIEYTCKIISLLKELRKVNTKSRKFIAGVMLDSLEDAE